ncbi:hypothetical protein WA171_005750 [Blastocystis sp. BT1]
MSSEEDENYNEQFDEELRALALMKGQKPKEVIKDTDGLQRALKRLETNLPWKESLDISVDVGEIKDPEDDIKRELAFYEASVKATMEGRKMLKENGIPYLRPEDYLAEMMKDSKKMDMIEKRQEAIEEEKKQKLRRVIRNKNKKRSNRKKYSRR